MNIEKSIRAAEAVLIPLIIDSLKKPRTESAIRVARLMETKGVPCSRLIYTPKPWRPQPRMIFNGITLIELGACYRGFVLILWQGLSEGAEKHNQVLAMGWSTDGKYPDIKPSDLFLDFFWRDRLSTDHFYGSCREHLPKDLAGIFRSLADPALVLSTLEAHSVVPADYCPF